MHITKTSRFDAKRHYLKDVVPLDTPYVVGLYPTDYCNLKCHYCLHSKSMENLVSSGCLVPEPMTWETFLNFANSLPLFSDTIKVLQISGLGEPTLHKSLPEMVKYLRNLSCIEQIKIVTNGLLLDADLAEKLIEAGVDRFEISIQGYDSLNYYRNAGVKIDFDKFYNNLTYLFKIRGKTKIYMQTLTSCLPQGGDEVFLQLFSKVCDYINIAPTLPVDEGVNFDGVIDKIKIINENYRFVCHQAFYQCFVLPDGAVVPCCESVRGRFISYGNVNKQNLYELWGGGARIDLLKRFLNFERKEMPSCASCISPNRAIAPYDILDDDARMLIKKFQG